MACDLSLGRLEKCKDSVGGITAVYFVNNGDLGAATYDVTDTDVITAIAGTPSCYKYDVRDGCSFIQNINSSDENGTSFFEQVLELMLPKLSVADHKELKLLTFGRPHVIIEDNNGNYMLAGLEHGLSVSGGTIATGANMGEMSGYTITLTGRERIPANFFDDTPANVGFTVVSGT